MWASAPTEAQQEVQWAGDRKGRPYESVYKECDAERNPPVTASPCQPPLGKGAKGTGDADCEAERICVSFRDQSADWSWESVIPLRKGRGERIATASVRTGFVMTVFYMGCRGQYGDAEAWGGQASAFCQFFSGS